MITRGDRLREDRDTIQAKIEALILERYRITNARRWLNLTQCAQEYDSLGAGLDCISGEIAALEDALDDADAAVAREDPERGPWGHDGL